MIFFFFIYFCRLSDLFGDEGRKKCQNGTFYDFSMFGKMTYFRKKCRFGTFYDLLSEFTVIKSAKTALFTTPGTIELMYQDTTSPW